MQEQHERLELNLDVLHNSLTRLENKLEPPLHPPYPPAPQESCGQAEPIHVVQMAEKFADCANVALGANTRVETHTCASGGMSSNIACIALFFAVAASIGFIASCEKEKNRQENALVQTMAKQGWVLRQRGWGQPEWTKLP